MDIIATQGNFEGKTIDIWHFHPFHMKYAAITSRAPLAKWATSVLVVAIIALFATFSPSEYVGTVWIIPDAPGGELPEFGFIMPRCVRTPTHNELWRENYRCIRQLFPTVPIVIIDDHSDTTLVDHNFIMSGATLVHSNRSAGKGEALPYYYFHEHKPFKKAVMLNDGMFILNREPLLSAIHNTTDYRFLWDFTYSQAYDSESQVYLIQTLSTPVQDEIETMRINEKSWAGCFASAAIMTWSFLDHLNDTYGFIHMLDAIQNRSHRMGLERLVALMSIHSSGMKPLSELSVYGSIHSHRRAFAYGWGDYVHDKVNGTLSNEGAVKIWNGRRRTLGR